MNYSQLTKTQKRCIDAFIRVRPELAKATSISRKDVEQIFWVLHSERESSGEKIGYPMWLVKGTKVGRGLYEFPAPSKASKSATSNAKKVETSKEKEDKEFFTELAENGIMETA